MIDAAKLLMRFILLTLVLSWVPGWLMVLAEAGWIQGVFLVLYGIGPAVSAMILNRADGGEILLQKFLVLPLKASCVALSLMVPLAILGATSLISQILPESHPVGIPKLGVHAVLTTMAFAIVANPWEEIAWRGYLLEQLQPKIGQIGSSLAIGVVAGLWHIPLFQVDDSLMSNYPFGYWLTGTVAISFVATLLFNSSGGSLLIASLFHVSINTQSVAFGVETFRGYSLVSILTILVCAVIMIRKELVCAAALRNEEPLQ